MLWLSLALVGLNLAVYGPVRNYDFVQYDDPTYVSGNPHVLSGLNLDNIAWAIPTCYASNWHPLTWISYMLDTQLFGVSPSSYHTTNLILHILNTLLLFGFLYRFTDNTRRSAFVAALFAVHPLHVESVSWIAERKDVLSTLLWMMTLWAYSAYANRRNWSRYLIVLVLFAFGLMAKPMLVTLPCVLLLLDLWPLSRIHLSAGAGRWLPFRVPWRNVSGLLLEKLPLFALSAAVSAITLVAQRKGGAVVALDQLPFSGRAANAVATYFSYIGSMIWPANLAVFYPFPRSLSVLWFGIALAVLSAVTLGVTRLAKNYPYLTVGWLWYVGTLVPVIGLIQVGSQTRADRYTYIPLIGLFIAVAWCVPDLLQRWPVILKTLPIVAWVIILMCAIAARLQVGSWANSASLWSHAIAVTKDNYVAENGLGSVFWNERKVDLAVMHFQEALRIKPDHADAMNNLGVIWLDQDKLELAASQFSNAIRINPVFAEAYNNLGTVRLQQGRPEEAGPQFSAALKINPDFADAHTNLGFALVKQGKPQEAASHFKEAANQFEREVSILPDDAQAHYNLGNALAMLGKIDDAINQYSNAIRIQPDYAEAHNNLGSVLLNQGRKDEARIQFSEAVRIRPDYVKARDNLALASGNRGR